MLCLKKYPQTKSKQFLFLFHLRLWSSLQLQRRPKSSTLTLFCLVKVSCRTLTRIKTSPIKASVLSRHIPLTATLHSRFQRLRHLKIPENWRSTPKAQPEPGRLPTLISPPAPPSTPMSSSLRLSKVFLHPSYPPLSSNPMTGCTALSALMTLSPS